MPLPNPDPLDPSLNWSPGPASGTGEPLYRLRRGHSPLIVSMPHVGLLVPPTLAAGFTRAAEALADTDWHLPRLYGFLENLDATVLVATHSRFVVDLNRPWNGANLYPGQDTTGLVPIDTFRREPIYRPGHLPDGAEIDRRRDGWWRPYHAALGAEITRVRREAGHVVLWDAHSIASELPRFFEGRLRDLNFGTARGTSCAASLREAVLAPVRAQQAFSWVVDGRFTGGHITRHYGKPEDGVHAIQLELSQCTYMDEQAPFGFREDRAAVVAPLLARCLGTATDWRPSR